MLRRLLAAVAATASAFALTTHIPAGAAPTAGSPAVHARAAGVDDKEAAGFARQRGISLADARQRLAWQAAAPDLSQRMARDLGTRSGGIWIDVNDGDRVKIGVTGGLDRVTGTIVDRAAAVVGLARAGYDLVPVKHSWSTIEADNNWLGDEIARVNKGASATLAAGLRTDLNAVELQTPREGTLTAAQRELVKAAKIRLGDRLVIGSYAGRPQPRYTCSYPYCDKPLRGGTRIFAHDVGACTGGFVARSKVDSKLYLFTAGHCGKASGKNKNWLTKRYGGSALNYIIGEIWNWKWDGGGDMAIIQITGTDWWNPKPWVYVTDGPDTTEDQTYHISSDNLSVVGMRICTTGGSYGRSDCGRVTQVGLTVTYQSGVTVHHLGRGSFCGTGGDSGAPMYAQHTAFGLQVGGFSECDSVYQSIRIAEDAMNVNVLHGTS